MTEFLIAGGLMGGSGWFWQRSSPLRTRSFTSTKIRVSTKWKRCFRKPIAALVVYGVPVIRGEGRRGQYRSGQCTVNSPDNIVLIAELLKVEAGGDEKRVARLACAAGITWPGSARDYEVWRACRAAALVSGGGKGCSWGCLGLADCERVVQLQSDRHGSASGFRW